MKARRHSNEPAHKAGMHPIVLFDGECRFCNGWVKFLLRRDKQDVFRFAPLQSDAAKSLLSSAMPAGQIPDSVIVVEGDSVYTHSSAVLRICKHLGGGWALFRLLLVVPSPLRDALYRFIAKRRYAWFGREQSCMMPTEETKRKFIG